MFSKIAKFLKKESSKGSRQVEAIKSGINPSSDIDLQKQDREVSLSEAQAQYDLGYQYVTGQDRPKDMNEGIKWIQRAADQKIPEALFHLGAMYHHGQGMPQDYSKAAQYYLDAAEIGHAKAQNNLAGLYAEGLGVSGDLTKALKWFQMASNNGHPTASQGALLTEMKLEMAAEDTQINLSLAEVKLKQEAEIRELLSSHPEPPDEEQQVVTPTMRFGQLPQNEIANFQSARDVIFNQESEKLLEAREELTRLYSAGYGEAFSVLGYMAIVYAGVEDDITDGLKILHKCSDAGDSGSTCLLGNIYEKGQTIKQDLAKAWVYYGKAIEQGSVAALTNKGVMAIQGRGVAKDVNLGMALLTKAREKGSIGAQELLEHFSAE